MANGSMDYKLGEICSELKDFNRRFGKNENEHREIFLALKELNMWRWKTVGMIGGVVTVVNLIVNYLFNISLT